MDGAGGTAELDDEVLAQAAPRRRGVLDEARARLARLGARALTDAELLGLVTGTEREGDLGALLEAGLKALLTAPTEALLEHPLLGFGAGARLLAAVELASRAECPHEARPRLATPAEIVAYVRPRVWSPRREEFHLFCLNSRNLLLRHVRVAEGSIDQCHVDPREVLAPAVACRATAIVLAHNHPSGDPEPSVHDVTLTRQLRDAARLLCIRLLDHLVLGDRGVVSMLARGLFTGGDGPWAVHLGEREGG